MKLKHTLTCIIVIALHISCSDQNNIIISKPQETIQGVVVSEFAHRPIREVEIDFKGIGVKTDTAGFFKIDIPESRIDLATDQISFMCFPYVSRKIKIDQLLTKSIADTVTMQLSVKWTMYQKILAAGIEQSYNIIPVIDWYRNNETLKNSKVIIMRHDVDMDAQAAKAMAYIENQMDIRSTYYFRWRTADIDQISYVRELGHEVGLHYETLASYCAEHHITESTAITPEIIRTCREILKSEIRLFEQKYGDINSICSHGAPQNRLLNVANSILVYEENLSDYYVEIDTNDPRFLKNTAIDIFIADSGSQWQPIPLIAAIQQNYHTILALVHPDWWGDMVISSTDG